MMGLTLKDFYAGIMAVVIMALMGFSMTPLGMITLKWVVIGVWGLCFVIAPREALCEIPLLMLAIPMLAINFA